LKTSFFLLCVSASLCLKNSAFAVDHNNIDAARPLDFDDAESVALHEKSLEFGASLVKPKGSKVGFAGSAELLYGLAPNSQVSVDFSPSYASRNGSNRSADFGDVGIGVLHNFNREIGNTPALALRADAALPSGHGSRGVDFRLRGIASKQFGQYGRLHLNLDLGINSSASAGERGTLPGVLLGYSCPLGYPNRFDRTLLAQVGFRANPDQGESGLLNLGIGVRQQISVRSVLDLGLKGDLTGGAARQTALTVGYSRQF
jgi:hypothetical protein